MALRKIRLCDDRTVINLIQEVEKYPCLWNVDDEHYNKRNQKLAAWMQVTAKLQLPEALLKAKWKNLRDRFKDEFRKLNVKTIDGYTGKWRYFKALWFLNMLENNTTCSGDDTSDIDIKDEKITYPEIDLDPAPDPAADPDPSPDPDPDPSPDPNHSPDPDPFEAYEEDTDQSNRKRSNSVTEEHDQFVDKRRRTYDDEYDMMFLEFLTPFFRELVPWRKLVVRNKMQDILLSELAAQNNFVGQQQK